MYPVPQMSLLDVPKYVFRLPLVSVQSLPLQASISPTTERLLVEKMVRLCLRYLCSTAFVYTQVGLLDVGQHLALHLLSSFH